MRYFKIDSEIEKKLQKIENLMSDLGISISSYNGLIINYKNKEYEIKDSETNEMTAKIPRMMEFERIIIDE